MSRAYGKAMVRRGSSRSNPDTAIALLVDRFVRRYGLVPVPGRPEELRDTHSSHAISIQYGAFQVRVRLMDGRTWVQTIDLSLDATHTMRSSKIVPILDAWFDYCTRCHQRNSTHKLDCSNRGATK